MLQLQTHCSSNIDKILEKLMHGRLMKFLTEQKILYLKQFGFRKNFSTAHAIINLIDSIGLFHLFAQEYGCKNPGGPLIMIFSRGFYLKLYFSRG